MSSASIAGVGASPAELLPVVLSASFVGFFVFAALLVRFRHRRGARKLFVFVVLATMTIPLVGLPQLPPFTSYMLYSQTAPEELETAEIRVVTEDGRELLYDARAAQPMTGPVLNLLAERMASACDPAEPRRFGAYLLENARAYRQSVTSDGQAWASYVDFPRHNLDFRWHESELRDLGRFTAVRVYEVVVTPGPDHGTAESVTERQLLEVSMSEGSPSLTRNEVNPACS